MASKQFADSNISQRKQNESDTTTKRIFQETVQSIESHIQGLLQPVPIPCFIVYANLKQWDPKCDYHYFVLVLRQIIA